MKEKLLKLSFILVIIFIFSFFSLSALEARQGCCSHHGGVCGCGCCDGTSLSATCAPYYPQCNKPVKQYVPPIEDAVPQTHSLYF